MSKFKEGQLVWWDSEPHKLYSSYSGWVITPFNSEKPEIIMPQELINLLTRDEIIQHMKDNGWNQDPETPISFCYIKAIDEAFFATIEQVGDDDTYYPMGNVFHNQFDIYKQVIDLQQEADNYATALNLCEQ